MKAHRWTQIAGALVAIAALAALAGCAPQPGAASSAGDYAGITVTGYGQARGDPDIATVNVGVNVVDTSIDAAVEKSNQTIADITQAMVALGISEADIQTTNFNVWPEDVYSPDTGQLTGEKRYHVDSTIMINVRDVGMSSDVLKTAIDHGANNIYGLSFGIDKTDDLAASARAAAIADARVRAEQVANELGVTLGEVTGATEVNGGPVYAYAYAAGIGGGGGPPISEGSLTVSAQMQVTFEIVR